MEGEEQQAHGPFPESVRDQALSRLRGLLKGNGVSPDKLDYQSMEGGLYTLEGYTRIEIGHTRTQDSGGKKRKKGGNYQKVENQEALEDAIATARRELCEKGDKRKHIVKQLLNTPDQGFNLEGYALDLEAFNSSFILPRECQSCHQKGQVACQSCQGNKRIQCRKCHGATQMTCPQCQGSSFIQGPNGRQTCQQCGGQGHVHCDNCRSSGFIACPKCGAKGVIKCRTCSGTGWHEEMTHLAFHATTRLEYNTQDLPRGLVRLLHKQAGELASAHSLKLHVGEESKSQSDHIIYVNYSGSLPYGKLHMRLNGKDLSAVVYGHDARLGDAPPFLEHCCATGIKALQRAAKNHGSVMGELKTAGHYRMLRQALRLTSQYKPRQAFHQLARHYPLGVRQPVLKGLVMKSDQALRNVTRRPRLIGLAIGLAFSGIVIPAYYLTIKTALPLSAPWQAGLVDLALVALCCGVTSASIHFMAMRGLRRAFAHIGADDGNAGKLRPRLDLSVTTGISAALGLYTLIIAGLTVMSDKAPSWAKAAYAILRDSLL